MIRSKTNRFSFEKVKTIFFLGFLYDHFFLIQFRVFLCFFFCLYQHYNKSVYHWYSTNYIIKQMFVMTGAFIKYLEFFFIDVYIHFDALVLKHIVFIYIYIFFVNLVISVRCKFATSMCQIFFTDRKIKKKTTN